MFYQSASRSYDPQTRPISANYFYSGQTDRTTQSEFALWQQSFFQKITTGRGIANTLGTSLGMNLVMRGISPLITNGIARLGIRAPLPALLLSTTTLSLITSGGMTLFSRWTNPSTNEQSFVEQWRVSLLYSLPSMLMGRFAMQRWGLGATLLGDAALEPIQAIVSTGLSYGMGGLGWLPETQMSAGQLFARELIEGFFYMGVGRTMGEAVDRTAVSFSHPPVVREWRLPLSTGFAGPSQTVPEAVSIAGVPIIASPSGLTISEIRGTHYTTAHRGEKVRGLEGVVTAVGRGGFWMQESLKTDPHVASGIYVHTTNPSVRVGDLAEVHGEVTVFRPGERDLSQTQIDHATYRVAGEEKLPEPVLIGEAGLLPPKLVFSGEAVRGDVEDPQTPFLPDQHALAFYKNLEDRRVKIQNALVVGASTRENQYFVAIDGGKHLHHKTPEGLPFLSSEGLNTDLLAIDFKLLPPGQRPHLQTGDRIVGDVVGVLDYTFGQFRLLVTTPVKVEQGHLQRKTVTDLVGDEEHFTVADSNFENYFPLDKARTEALADIILKNLKNPDVIALQEGMDNSGSKDDGTIKAAYEPLNEEITRRGGKTYQYVEVAPQNNHDGGKPGGNIRVAYLVRTDRIALTLHGNADYDDPAKLTSRNGQWGLNQNPSRVDPLNPAYERSRKPLAIEYEFNGQKILQVNLHSTSRRGDDPLWGRFQPPLDNSSKVRSNQHKPVIAFWESARAFDPEVSFIVGGDFNAYAWEESVRLFTKAGLVDLAEHYLPPGANYTYFYDGIGHYHSFDHLLTSSSLAREAQIEILHINAGLSKQFSDHDVKIARFRVPKKSG